MKLRIISSIASVVLASILVVGSSIAAERSYDLSEQREPCAQYDPLRRAHFGDLHVHTTLSLDAVKQGTITSPADAYRRTPNLMSVDIALASHLADWAFYGAPDDVMAQQLVLDVYKERILDPGSYTQESLAYLDFMALIKQRQIDGRN